MRGTLTQTNPGLGPSCDTHRQSRHKSDCLMQRSAGHLFLRIGVPRADDLGRACGMRLHPSANPAAGSSRKTHERPGVLQLQRVARSTARVCVAGSELRHEAIELPRRGEPAARKQEQSTFAY